MVYFEAEGYEYLPCYIHVHVCTHTHIHVLAQCMRVYGTYSDIIGKYR